MALASWRVMAVSQKLARREIFHPEKGQAVQYLSFTSIYDACKSAKGVCLNRDSMLAVFAGRFRDENKTKGLGNPEALFITKSATQRSDQRHQLKRQTRDDVTVWMNFSDCTNSVPVTPPRIALSFLLNVLNRYSVFQYRPGSQSNLYSYPPPRNQPVYLRSARDGPIAPVLRLKKLMASK